MTTNAFKVFFAIAALLMLAPSASAQTITADQALTVVNGCVTYAKAKQHSHAVAVYNPAGQPIALLTMDGNPPGVTEFAMRKAAAVAHWRFPTAQMTAAVQNTPGFAAAPMVVTVPGGIPVYATGGQFLGAVGVSGEDPTDDVACAEAGVRAAGLLLSRPPAN
jgi:uncharacterized protein GlcG (DUF336 family)